MGFKLLVLPVLAALAAGCAHRPAPLPAESASGIDAPAPDWRSVATQSDRDRLRRWRDAWMTALPAARAADGKAIAREGALFQPDNAMPGAMPPAGEYRCRVFKLGGSGAAMRDFTAYPFFDCRVDDEGDVKSFYKLTGSQRPIGHLFADGASRAVFLGTLMLGDEQTALEYGRDDQRDMAGFVERVGERRWRMALPWPSFESQLDVVELVPAA